MIEPQNLLLSESSSFTKRKHKKKKSKNHSITDSDVCAGDMFELGVESMWKSTNDESRLQEANPKKVKLTGIHTGRKSDHMELCDSVKNTGNSSLDNNLSSELYSLESASKKKKKNKHKQLDETGESLGLSSMCKDARQYHIESTQRSVTDENPVDDDSFEAMVDSLCSSNVAKKAKHDEIDINNGIWEPVLSDQSNCDESKRDKHGHTEHDSQVPDSRSAEETLKKKRKKLKIASDSVSFQSNTEALSEDVRFEQLRHPDNPDLENRQSLELLGEDSNVHCKKKKKKINDALVNDPLSMIVEEFLPSTNSISQNVESIVASVEEVESEVQKKKKKKRKNRTSILAGDMSHVEYVGTQEDQNFDSSLLDVTLDDSIGSSCSSKLAKKSKHHSRSELETNDGCWEPVLGESPDQRNCDVSVGSSENNTKLYLSDSHSADEASLLKKKKKKKKLRKKTAGELEIGSPGSQQCSSESKVQQFSDNGFCISQDCGTDSPQEILILNESLVESPMSSDRNQHCESESRVRQLSNVGFCISQSTSNQSSQKKSHIRVLNRDSSKDLSLANGSCKRRLDVSLSSEDGTASHSNSKRIRTDVECTATSEDASTSRRRYETLKQTKHNMSSEHQRTGASDDYVEFHTVNTVSPDHWKEVCNELVEKGVDFNVGKWSHEETLRLKNNWEEILKNFPWENPHHLFMFKSRLVSSDEAYQLIKYIQDTQFYIQLGRGIRRSLNAIYSKARTQFMPGHLLGTFSEEDTEALKRIVELKGNDWQYAGEKIERNSRVARERHRTIKEGQLKGTWSEAEDFLLEELVAEYLGKKDGRVDDDIPFDIPWTEIGARMPTRNYKQCRLHWTTKRNQVEGQTQPNKVSTSALVKAIAEQNPQVRDAIDWMEVRERLGRAFKPQYYQLRLSKLLLILHKKVGVKPFNESLELLTSRYVK